MVVSIGDNIVVDFVVDGDVNEERSADVLSLAAFERKNVFDLSVWVSGDVDNIIVDIFVNGADNEVSDEILSTVVGELT